MHRFFQSVFQRVGRRKRGEVGEHDFFQPNIVQHGLKNERARSSSWAAEKTMTPTIVSQLSLNKARKHQHHSDGRG